MLSADHPLSFPQYSEYVFAFRIFEIGIKLTASFIGNLQFCEREPEGLAPESKSPRVP